MVYQWNLPGLYSVSAQDAGQELERIYDERGKLDPPDIVEESRPDGAVLHPCFEWRDEVAAEKYREEQARHICRCIVRVEERENKEPLVCRAVLNVQGSYHPISVIVRENDKYNELLQSAKRELASFRKKFAVLSDRGELKAVFEAIDAVDE